MFAAIVAVAVVVAGFAAAPAGAAITCTKTQNSGEAVSAFLSRLGSNEEGCLVAGTYSIGNLSNFKVGQKLHPAPSANGGYQKVTLRGTLSLNVGGLSLNDLFIVGVPGTGNGKVLEVLHCDNCRIDHLDITTDPPYASAPTQGILNLYPTTGLQITNNKIHGIGDDGQFDHGIYCDESTGGGVIEGNWIYDNGAFGIQFYPNCDDVTFAHNVLDGNGALAWCSASSPSGGGCATSNSNGRGLIFGGEGSKHSDTVSVRNNVLSTFGGAGFSLVSCYQPGTGDSVRDTLLYQASGSDDSCGSSIQRSGVIHGLNPMYVDRANHDYRLQQSSPARALMGSYADAVPGPRLDGAGPPPADTTPPETTLDSGPSGSTTSTSASFSFSSSESGSSFECRIDAGAWGSCSSPKAYSSLSTSGHSFDVRAKDSAGNTDPTPATRSWTITPPPPADTTPPETTLDSGPSGSTTSTSASFSFSSSESGSSFECRIDAGAWGSCSSPKAYSSLSTSGHSFDVRAKDSAGNTDPTPATRSWTITPPPPPADPTPTSAPSVSFRAPRAGQVVSGQLNESKRNCEAVVATDAGVDRVDFYVDGRFVNSERDAPYACVVDTRRWANGSHTIKAVAYDKAGQSGSAAVQVTFSNRVKDRGRTKSSAPLLETGPAPRGPSARLRLTVAAISSASSRRRPKLLRLVGSVPPTKRAQVRRVRIQALVRGRWRTVRLADSRRGRFRVRWLVRRAHGRRLRLRAAARGVRPSKVLSVRLG